MRISVNNFVTTLIFTWLAVAGTVLANDVAGEPRSGTAGDFSGLTLVCRPGTNATEFVIYRKPAGGALKQEAAYRIKGIQMLREVEVYTGGNKDNPDFHVVSLLDQSVRVFRNDAGRRRQYASYIIQAEAGKPGSWAVYHAQANIKSSFRSAVFEVDENNKTTRVFRAEADGKKVEESAVHVPHATLLNYLRRVRIRGLDPKVLGGVIGAIDLLK